MRAHPAGPRHGDVIAPAGAPICPDDVNAISPAIWPRTSGRRASGELAVGGLGVSELAAQYGTPLYVLDEMDARSRARALHDAYEASDGSATVYYASKAFLATAVARWVTSEGLGMDVATGGELAVALRAGVPGDRLLMHGNNKSVAELQRAVAAGVSRVVIDSFDEIERLAQVAEEAGVVQPVLVRVTVGVEAHTHEFIATAHEDQKFGLSISSGAAVEAVRRIMDKPFLDFRGLHSHIGSQIFDAAGFEAAAARVVAFVVRLRDEENVDVSEVNLGGGMGIAYTGEDDPIDADELAGQIRDIVGKTCANEGVPMPKLAFEPGRAIIGPAGITVYEVGTVKPVDIGHGHVRTYVSVDGGMSDNIRTALYDADYTVVLASRVSEATPILVRIVGKHCESGDIVVRDAWLPGDVQPGDLLAVAATGAYCRSMASQYNYLPRPAVVSVREGESATVLRRETEDDLLRLDPGA